VRYVPIQRIHGLPFEAGRGRARAEQSTQQEAAAVSETSAAARSEMRHALAAPTAAV